MNIERELKRYVRQIRPGLIGANSNANVNLQNLVEELKVSKGGRTELASALQNYLTTRDFVSALSETGLTLEHGVFSELWSRFESLLLPRPVDDNSVQAFVSRILDSQSDSEWIESVDPELLREFLLLILPSHESMIDAIGPQLFMALEILSLRLAGLGFDPVVSTRLRQRRDYQAAYMEVPRHVHSLLDGKGDTVFSQIRAALEGVKSSTYWIRQQSQESGISLALTYRVMKIQQVVRRMELLLDTIQSAMADWSDKPAFDLFYEILILQTKRFNLRSFLTQNVELLAFQITEHAGRVGEHYITRSRSEWAQMFRSAALGGAVVAVLALLKILASMLKLPPGMDFLLSGIIYSLGFVAIIEWGGVLATKQPAMTASRLAATLDDAKDSISAMTALADTIICTVRTQLIAVAGNVLVSLPVAVLLVWPFVHFGHGFIPNDKAWVLIDSLHPFKSLSLFYAAVAGVGLFLSGLLAGFMQNWFMFNQVGERLRLSEQIRGWVGAANMDRTVQLINSKLGAWVGNVALGFFLALMPAMGKIFGLPLDVRHVTFSAAQFGIGLASLDFMVPTKIAVAVLICIFLIGLVNLAVSFSLSLFVAVRSRKIRFSQTPLLMKVILRHLKSRPWEFLVPPT